MAYSPGSPFVSQSFSRTRTVSHDNQEENGHVEVTRVWNYKRHQFDQIESPYGPAEIPLFGPQYGMTASKDVEPIKPPYGKAEVPLFGPQYGIAALTREQDLHNDGDEDGLDHPKIKKTATVRVEVLNSLEDVSQDAGHGSLYTEERNLEGMNTNARSETKQPTNDSILESWTYQYDAVSREYGIVYGGSAGKIKPEAKAMATRVPDSSLLSQVATPKLEIDEVYEEIPVSSSFFRLPQLTNSSLSPRASVETTEIPVNPFADSTVAEATWDIYDYSEDETDILVTPKTGPTSCIICTDDFSATFKPPGWISVSCLHEPSVCCECLARWIKSDLEGKIWNQITCPECKTLLVYEDIQRLADPETFAKYVNPNILI